MKKIDKNYDFESPAPTAKTLHSRYEMRLSSNEQPAPSTRGVLIGRAGEPRGEIGKVCCLLLVFKGDKWAYRPKKTRPSDSWINYEPDDIRIVTENPDWHVEMASQKTRNMDINGIKWPFSLDFTANINIFISKM